MFGCRKIKDLSVGDLDWPGWFDILRMNLFVSLVFALFLTVPVVFAGTSKSLMCDVVGPCINCRSVEIDADYCRDTGKRVKIHCKDEENEFDDYKSCTTTAEDDQVQVIIFQVFMAIFGGLAYWGVQTRKKYNMSLFDTRKLRFAFSDKSSDY
jgi:hypothetical protein